MCITEVPFSDRFGTETPDLQRSGVFCMLVCTAPSM
nr:MAG TPA: hypothetical protein [Caudoviricetes sp.]